MERSAYKFLSHIGLPAYCVAPSDLGDLVFVACNDAWVELAGATRAELIGEKPADIVPQFFDDANKAVWEKAHRRTFLGSEKSEFRLTLQRNTLLQVHLSPMFDEQGDVSAMTAIAHQIEEPNMRANAGVAQLSREMEKFISMAAHDLRTPMRNVQSLADLLRDDFVDMGDGKLELIDLLEDVAIKATALISDVLSYAQATSGENAKETFRLDVLCDDIHLVVDPSHTHGVFAPPTGLEAEKAAIQIIVRNLIDNALKHSKREIVAVDISVEAGANGMLVFTVADDGKGFQDPALAFLDGGDFRVDSGYGMLGIRRMIKERGGTISAENQGKDGGGIVRFSLPGRIIATEKKSAVA
ncbi:MAG: ATP-binding protein [Litoreibacter sp.]|nr:ATP-binding protein [Litoreibacter sp.]